MRDDLHDEMAAADAAWARFHRRMCRITAATLVVAAAATLAVLVGL